MTPPDLHPGRPAATRRPFHGPLSALLLSLACVAPAQAGNGLAADSADQLPEAAPVSQTVASPASVQAGSSEPLLFAQDINRIIQSQAGQQAAAPVDGSGGRMQTVLKRALALLGTPYRWGGDSTEGFDCSGLVGYVFRTVGIELPRVSREMAANGEKIDRDALTAGDLVFFSRRGRRVDHVGIYVGNGQFVHAPRTGRDVTVSSLSDGYWSRKFMQARRVPGV